MCQYQISIVILDGSEMNLIGSSLTKLIWSGSKERLWQSVFLIHKMLLRFLPELFLPELLLAELFLPS